MFQLIGLFALVLVSVAWFFSADKRGQVIVTIIYGLGVLSKTLLIGCGLYFLLWVAFH